MALHTNQTKKLGGFWLLTTFFSSWRERERNDTSATSSMYIREWIISTVLWGPSGMPCFVFCFFPRTTYIHTYIQSPKGGTNLSMYTSVMRNVTEQYILKKKTKTNRETSIRRRKKKDCHLQKPFPPYTRRLEGTAISIQGDFRAFCSKKGGGYSVRNWANY